MRHPIEFEKASKLPLTPLNLQTRHLLACIEASRRDCQAVAKKEDLALLRATPCGSRPGSAQQRCSRANLERLAKPVNRARVHVSSVPLQREQLSAARNELAAPRRPQSAAVSSRTRLHPTVRPQSAHGAGSVSRRPATIIAPDVDNKHLLKLEQLVHVPSPRPQPGPTRLSFKSPLDQTVSSAALRPSSAPTRLLKLLQGHRDNAPRVASLPPAPRPEVSKYTNGLMAWQGGLREMPSAGGRSESAANGAAKSTRPASANRLTDASIALDVPVDVAQRVAHIARPGSSPGHLRIPLTWPRLEVGEVAQADPHIIPALVDTVAPRPEGTSMLEEGVSAEDAIPAAIDLSCPRNGQIEGQTKLKTGTLRETEMQQPLNMVLDDPHPNPRLGEARLSILSEASVTSAANY
mmetsp:Transcript_54351/g.140386  ORF Transcript_54351/g.140386 Transcript_54351/m.140386 type:complete len:408 (-) Transcript_54351:181-1404(-)